MNILIVHITAWTYLNTRKLISTNPHNPMGVIILKNNI